MLKLVGKAGERPGRTKRVRLSASGSDWKYLFVALGELAKLKDRPEFFGQASHAVHRAMIDAGVVIPEDDQLYVFKMAPAEVRAIFQSIMNLCNGLATQESRREAPDMFEEAIKLSKMLNPLLRQAEAQGWTAEVLDGL